MKLALRYSKFLVRYSAVRASLCQDLRKNVAGKGENFAGFGMETSEW